MLPEQAADSQNSSRARWWIPAVIFLLALLFRVGYLQEVRSLPDFEAPLVDAGYHDYWAWGLASGEWTLPAGAMDPEIESTPYFRPPLVVYWMATLFSLVGHDHYLARVIQILLGSLSCVLTYLLGKRLFGTSSGAIAGLLSAVYWMLVYFDTEYREVSLLVFLYLALMLALLRYRDKPSVGRTLPAALALGLAILAKPNGLLLLPVLAGWMAYVTRKSQGRKQHLLHALALGLGTLACVLPVTVRNWVAADELVLISSNGGINFLIGNNPTSNGTQVTLPPEIPPFDSAFDYPGIVRSIEAREGRSMTHAEASGWFSDLALEHIRSQPGATLSMWLRKAAAFWVATEIVSEKDLLGSRAESTVLRLLPLNFASLFASALLGLWLALRAPSFAVKASGHPRRVDREGAVLVALFVVLFGLSFMPFFVTARYRAPILPLLLVFSGFAIQRVGHFLRVRNWRAASISALALLALYFGDHFEVPDYQYDPAKAITERGALLAMEGKLEEAERTFREAVAINPQNAHARGNLGLFLQQSGRAAEAVVELRLALKLDGRDYRIQQNLGLALVSSGQPEEAMGYLQKAQQLQPRNAELAFQAGEVMRSSGHLGPARSFLEKSLDLNPTSSMTNISLGLTYLSARQPGGASQYLLKATQLDPRNANAFNLLGVSYAQSGRAAESLAAFESAVRLAPRNKKFIDNRDRARAGGG